MLLLANIFQPLIDVFHSVLLFFHEQGGLGWGVSIIALTVAARIVLLPLTIKQFRSMQEMQRLSPQIKALQAKYKQDKQRLNQEMMRFYQEHKINPLASCLPLVLQLPIFISLYYMLRNELRHDICPGKNALHAAHTVPCGSAGHAGFLFIPDLTDKAGGLVLVVLIVLYIGSQVASTLMMSQAADKNQKRIMLVLPVIFVSFVVRFPAGLVVYWITTNFWTIAQQLIVRRSVGSLRPVEVPAAAGAAGAQASDGGPLARLRAVAGLEARPEANGGGGGTVGGDGAAGNGARAGASRSSAKGAKAGGTARSPDRVGARSGGSRGGPPPSARKKKKRSGRRR